MGKEDEDTSAFVMGVLTGALLCCLIFAMAIWNTQQISNTTAIDICQQLTGNYSVKFDVSTNEGKLICSTPSFDNTQNIIIKSNSDSVNKLYG